MDSNVACFAGGCLLTFLGVKLLTSRRPRRSPERSRASDLAAPEERGGGGRERGLSAGLLPSEHPSACVHASAPADASHRGPHRGPHRGLQQGEELRGEPSLASPGGAEYPAGSPGWSPRGPRPLWSPGGGFGGFGTPPRARDDAEGGHAEDDGGLPSLSLLNTPLGMSSARCDANHNLRLRLP